MTIKPISISKSLWYFLMSSVLIYWGLYYAIPLLLEKGIPFFTGYFIFFHIPIFLLLLIVLILYRSEGNGWNWSDFKERMELTRMSGNDWLWAIGLFTFGLIVYVGFAPLGEWLAKFPFFSPPDFFPPEINPNKIRVSGYMMNYRLSGQYWIAVTYLFAWLTNILGEELLFRGIILPRQIRKYGSTAWIYHGLIWAVWHFFWKWNLLSILPFALALSFAVYKKRNLWISIFAHGLLNFIPLIMIIIEVFK